MKYILFLVLISNTMFAQEIDLKLTGNLNQDIQIVRDNTTIDDTQTSIQLQKRSVLFACGISAILPGSCL